MIFHIWDLDDKILAHLEDIQEASMIEEINGELSLILRTAPTEFLVEGNKIGFYDADNEYQLFEIKVIEDERNSGNLIKYVYAEHESYELIDDFVDDRRPSGSAETCLTSLLLNSRWQVGTVVDLGSSQLFFYRESVKSGLAKLINTFAGEIKYRITITNNEITGRYVDISERRGSLTGKRFEYDKDLKSIRRKVDMTNLITACYGYGKGEEIESETGGTAYGRRITFASVEWSTGSGDPVNKSLGVEFVADTTALALWGRESRHRYGKYENDEITDPEILLEKTWEYLQANSTPKIYYALDVALLESITGYAHEKVRLGDTVAVIDRGFNPEIRASARVLKFENNLLEPEKSKVVLANFITGLTNLLIDSVNVIDRFRAREGAYDDGSTRAIDGLDNSGYVNLPIHGGRIVNDDVEDGLNYNNTYMGYYNLAQDAWRAYIDNQGRFLFQRDANSYFKYDGSSFEFRGPLVADDITSGKLQSTDGETYFDLNNSEIKVQNYSMATSSTFYMKFAPFTARDIDPLTGLEVASTNTVIMHNRNGTIIDGPAKYNGHPFEAIFDFRAFEYIASTDTYIGEITNGWNTTPSLSEPHILEEDRMVRIVFRRKDLALVSSWGNVSYYMSMIPLIQLAIRSSGIIFELTKGSETIFSVNDSGECISQRGIYAEGNRRGLSFVGSSDRVTLFSDNGTCFDHFGSYTRLAWDSYYIQVQYSGEFASNCSNFAVDGNSIPFGIDSNGPYIKKNNAKLYLNNHHRTFKTIEEDFINKVNAAAVYGSELQCFTGQINAIGSVTDWNLAMGDHIGCVAIRVSAGGSGGVPKGAWMSSATFVTHGGQTVNGLSTYIMGNERLTVVFQLRTIGSSFTHRFGRYNANLDTFSVPNVGYNIFIDGTGDLRGGTSNATQTSTWYRVSVNTWYRAVISVNAAKTVTTFTLFSESGTQLWTSSISQTLSTQSLAIFSATSLSIATTANDLMLIDYIKYEIERELTR